MSVINLETLTIAPDMSVAGVFEEAERLRPASPCLSCSAACCRQGKFLPLTIAEVEALEGVGTELRVLSKEESLGNRPGWRRKFYELITDCGFLDQETGQCEAYASPERPNICGRFEAGGRLCQIMRAERERTESTQHSS